MGCHGRAELQELQLHVAKEVVNTNSSCNRTSSETKVHFGAETLRALTLTTECTNVTLPELCVIIKL